MKKLLLIVSLLACSCTAVNGEDMVVMSRDDYNKDIMAATAAGFYHFCYSMIGDKCRDKMLLDDYGNAEQRQRFVDGISPFTDSFFSESADFDSLEKWIRDNN